MAKSNCIIISEDITIPVIGITYEENPRLALLFASNLAKRFRSELFSSCLLVVEGVTDTEAGVFSVREKHLAEDVRLYINEVEADIFLLLFPVCLTDTVAEGALLDMTLPVGLCDGEGSETYTYGDVERAFQDILEEFEVKDEETDNAEKLWG